MKPKKIIAACVTLGLVASLCACANPIHMVKGFFSDKSGSDIVESVENAQNDELRSTVLYYKDDKGLLVPVMRKIPWTEGKGIAKASLRAIMDTPANRKDIEGLGLTPIIPPNTQIKGMSIHDGTCKVDLTADFLNTLSQEEENVLVKGVVYTLTEFPTIDQVQIMINGSIKQAMNYGTHIASAISRQDINLIGDASNEKVVIYYEGTSNGLESYFVPVTASIEKEDNKAVNVLDALDLLVEGPPDEMGLYSEIPKGTKVVSVDVNDNIACVELSEEFLEIGDNDQATHSVAKSLGLTIKEQFPNIDGVKLLVNGQELNIGQDEQQSPMIIPTFANQYE